MKVIIAAAVLLLFMASRVKAGPGAIAITGLERYKSIIIRNGVTYAVDPCLIAGIIQKESSFNANAERFEPKLNESSVGLMQLLLSTARQYEPDIGRVQLFDPETNIRIGCRHLLWHMQRGFKFPEQVDVYNVGIGNYRKGVRNADYRTKVIAFMKGACPAGRLV